MAKYNIERGHYNTPSWEEITKDFDTDQEAVVWAKANGYEYLWRWEGDTYSPEFSIRLSTQDYRDEKTGLWYCGKHNDRLYPNAVNGHCFTCSDTRR